MKRNAKRLTSARVQAFLVQMQEYARELGAGQFTVSLEDAMHLWAEGEISDYVWRHENDISGKKGQREFREWLRTEPSRMVRLIEAARRRLAAQRRAK